MSGFQSRQTQSFQREVIADNIPDLLDQAIAWIAENLEPEDVFSAAQLQIWARQNDFVDASDVSSDFI